MTVQEWLGQDNQLGIDIWQKKYQHNGESFDEWLDRVSGGNNDLRTIIKEKKFLFGGRTLANRGTGKKGSFSNCYSRGFVEDDLEDLLGSAKDIGLTYKAQGGQGISLSKIRPKGCGINDGQFESDGIVPFMEIFNQTTMGISQGGSRKGALIMSLDIWHKEAETFIKIKSEEGRIEKANLSLEIDDEFMNDVRTYYKTGEVIKRTINRNYNGNAVEYEVTPIELYKLMMSKAYDWAEPGCIFTERFRNYNLMELDSEYKIETCNPCGEQPLPKHGACNLGSINLSEFVIDPFTENSYIDLIGLDMAVEVSIVALDTVLDENMDNHPLPEQREMAYNYRNVGLGIMGMHDLFIKLGITYGSKDSIDIMDGIMRRVFRRAVIASSKLAELKGTFPKYKSCVLDSSIIKNHFTSEELFEFGIMKNGLRNCSLLSIAPSGTIGTMLNISTGCEPLFQLSYKRKTESLNGGEPTYYDVFSGVVNEYKKVYDVANLPSYFNTSSSIYWKNRIDIQAILQNHVDTAISSTINLPNETTQDEIEELYLYAWEKGLKGVTIFRDGCARIGVLTTDNSDKKEETIDIQDTIKFDSLKPITRKELGARLAGTTYVKDTACGKLYITVNRDENDNLVEVFIDAGKSGGCAANAECLGRYASAAMRVGMSIDSIVDISKGVKCSACVQVKGSKSKPIDGISCGDIVARVIKEEYDHYHKKDNTKKVEVSDKPKCPECGNELIFEGGCNTCKNCGYSKCD